jgi:hypothetical protein
MTEHDDEPNDADLLKAWLIKWFDNHSPDPLSDSDMTMLAYDLALWLDQYWRE